MTLMKIAGLIAEFNPLHNGHHWLLQTARQQYEIDAIICVMSGSFLQRGRAAVCNKWSRAEMAVRAGCDLVLELPCCYAVRSANYFAQGAIKQLQSAGGLCTHLLFAAEAENPALLHWAAEVLAQERPDFKALLKHHLSHGVSFAAARAAALQVLSEEITRSSAWLHQPNNILAIEYLRALHEEHFPLQPLILARQGSGFHNPTMGTMASATAIRTWLKHPAEEPSALRSAMPESALHLLNDEILTGRAPLWMDAIAPALLAQIRSAPMESLAQLPEMEPGLPERIYKAARRSGTLNDLRHAIKTKRYTLSRIDRSLLYVLLNLRSEDLNAFDQCGPQYLRVLSFSELGRDLLHEVKQRHAVPIITRAQEIKSTLRDNEFPQRQAMLRLDLQATDLHALLYPEKSERYAGRDFLHSAKLIKNMAG